MLSGQRPHAPDAVSDTKEREVSPKSTRLRDRDVDPERMDFVVESFGESFDRELRGAIESKGPNAYQSSDRTDVENVTRILPAHDRQDLAGHFHHAQGVHFEMTPDLL